MKYLFTVDLSKESREVLAILENYIQTKNSVPVVVFVPEYYKGYLIFHYNAAAYLETEDFLTCLLGNVPYILDTKSGDVYLSGGSSCTAEHYIDNFILEGS